MTPSTSMVAMNLLADQAQPFQQHISLMHGWVPWAVQAVTATVLSLAIGWRSTRWRVLWLPLALIVGVAVSTTAHFYIDSAGLAGDPAPRVLWIWIGLTGFAFGVAVFGWRGSRWWRRGVSTLAVPMCALSAALALNLWVGYLPTVQTAWNQLTAGPLPDETNQATVTAMQKNGTQPATGTLVPVAISDTASHFKHRGELVYLPPAWYATNPPPKLPTVIMIGGEFNTPADWSRAGNAIKTIDEFAAAHDGNAPVFAFVDSGGAFNNDTECVNGSRGNAADHLTKDVVPFMISNFGVSPNRANWGVVGWSMGGTCAVDLAVMHPDMFSAFEDIAGDIGPNSGTKAQTIARLFSGNAAAYAAFDPATVITKHGPYTGVSGWFAINSSAPRPQRRNVPVADTGAVGVGGRDTPSNPGNQAVAANQLCGLGQANGINCAVEPQPGKHDWPFATAAFKAALPWLAGQLSTPGVPRIPLPDPNALPPSASTSSAPHTEAAGR